MILFGRKHLHVSESDLVVDSLFKILTHVTSGSENLEVASKLVFKVEIKNRNTHDDGKDDRSGTVVRMDLLEPAFFSAPNDKTGLYDKLKTATEFAQKLTDNDITFFLLRKRKEAITLGERARPSLSRIITRSDDIQLNSLKESPKLKNDFGSDLMMSRKHLYLNW